MGKLNEDKPFKPTLRKPMSDQSKNFEKNFRRTMNKHDLTDIREVDELLTEREQSLKKKIFSLPKMEALVHADPKLSAVYDEMAENGEEKYGYHYNETIMNMIFNDYVLNSQQYLQKYKMAIPKEKKRRDKSGINQLKKAAKKERERNVQLDKTAPSAAALPQQKEGDVQETTSAGGGATGSGYGADYTYSQPAIWSKSGKPERHKKPAYPGGAIVAESNYLTESKGFEKYYEMLNEEENILNEKSVSKSQQKFMGMVHAYKKGELPDASDEVKKAADSMKADDAEDFASTKHKGLPEKVPEKVDENPAIAGAARAAGMAAATGFGTGAGQELAGRVADKVGLKKENNIKETQDTMIQSSEDSMKNTPQPEGDLGTNVEMGTQSSGGMMREGDEKMLEQLDEELKAFSIHHDKLKKLAEDRKPHSLVLKDRLGVQNQKNFKSDLQQSGTKDILDVEKELQWKDQQTEVGDDPQKLGADIEKNVIKTTKGDAFKNVGDSANLKGDEIPKRNLTTPEQEEVDKMRLGQEDLVYDNEPNEKFEKKIEVEMGEELNKQGEEGKEYRAKAPLYNKDTQPVEDGEDKVQYDKEKTGWADRYGLKENMFSGRFVNPLGKSQVINFNLNEVTEVTDPKLVEYLEKINFNGLGNTYSNRGVLNEEFVNASQEYEFYTDGKEVLVMKVPAQKLDESVQTKEKPSINEDVEKIKHLTGYHANDYVSTDNIKKNRGF